MNSKSRCWEMNKCEKSLTFHFIKVARWVALFLLVGIGALGAYFQHEHGQEINWMFLGVCVACGVMLFWMGRCILKSECQYRMANSRCGKHVKTVSASNLPTASKMG